MSDSINKTGVFIMNCFPGSPAEKAGAKQGDRIISVNGTPTPQMQDFIDIERGPQYEMEVLRGNEIITLYVDTSKNKDSDLDSADQN